MRKHAPDLLILGLLFLLPLMLFWPQTVGGRTLLPAENLYQFEPYASYRAEAGAPDVPHNHLLSDLVLQNMQWKHFIRANISAGELPLWNPYQFGGIPFFAAGQQSTLYPFSLIYYALPLSAAYGWFTVVQLWLAGAFMYAFLRGLGIGRFGGAVGGVAYQLAAFFVISAVFPMIIASAAWLPLLLLAVEFIIARRPLFGRSATIPWAVVGAVALGCNILAGHVEITYYTLLISGYYALIRLIASARAEPHPLRPMLERAGALLGMIALGLMLGAVQFIPLYEFASVNWRAERSSLETVLSYAHPPRDLLQFALPNFYGSPAHHTYFDWFTLQTVPMTVNSAGDPITHTEWGMKNYVEGALYLGVLPLALALYGLLSARRTGRALTAGIFAALALLGLSFMFGLPTYALLYLLPGINQLNSPFRWIFAVTLSVAVLAGLGADALARDGRRGRPLGWALLLIGAGALAGLLLSRLFYPQIEPILARLLESMVTASGEPAATRFSGPAMFYSYQFTHVLIFGLVSAGAGAAVLWVAAARRGAMSAVVALIAADLMIASWGFNPASDPALLDYTPPAIAWLQDQPGEWRYLTLDDPTQPPLFQANMTWRYGLRDVRGYESIIPAHYVDYLRALAPQVQLDFNRIAPLYTVYPPGIDFDYAEALESPLLRDLGVRYLITHPTTTLSNALEGWSLAYEDEAVRIWSNGTGAVGPSLRPPAAGTAALTVDTGRERLIDVTLSEPALLVFNETDMPGWRAFIRPQGAGDDAEAPLAVERVDGLFQGVPLDAPGAWTVRLVYSPASFNLGLFVSFIGAALIAFLLGVWGWRAIFSAEASGAGRVARNSAAPILLNLFNRGIDFGFAFIMLRILGPEDAGIYYYAAFIFGWFDIFTNFGLDVYLTREVSRDRSRAAQFFFTGSALRLGLSLLGLIPLWLFLTARQGLVAEPLAAEGIIAILLLYIGLFPGSLSKGMTSLFYAFEQAEYPAAITTLSTISKALLGVVVLVLGFGVIGLAAASIVTNVLTFGVLLYGGRRLIGAWARPQVAAARSMLREGWPLMLNHFLATIFFQIDVVIMEAARGARMVGQYSVAYKWVSALNVIPAFFTMALLPLMSRLAREDRPALKRHYGLAIKLLVSTALPLAVLFTYLAYVLTEVLGGAQYLPDGAIATQLMIWSIPFGWINSLTQYVLIALDLQRKIMRAFIVAVSFNIISNLLLIPEYGYQAAALTTIASEIILLVPFARLLHGALGPIPWAGLLWRPVAAAGARFLVMLPLWAAAPPLALVAGLAVYGGGLLMLRPFDADELARLRPLLPGRLRALLPG